MFGDESDGEPGGVRAWEEHTSAFDRVKSVTMTLTKPQPAPWIAEEAAVSSNTARDHLSRLVDLSVVMTTQESGTRQYYQDPLYTRLRDIQELCQELTKQELSEQAAELKNDITTWKAEYDTASPDALRERAAASDTSAEQAYELVQTASDWELARYRLSLVQDAIENYETWLSDRSSVSV